MVQSEVHQYHLAQGLSEDNTGRGQVQMKQSSAVATVEQIAKWLDQDQHLLQRPSGFCAPNQVNKQAATSPGIRDIEPEVWLRFEVDCLEPGRMIPSGQARGDLRQLILLLDGTRPVCRYAMDKLDGLRSAVRCETDGFGGIAMNPSAHGVPADSITRGSLCLASTHRFVGHQFRISVAHASAVLDSLGLRFVLIDEQTNSRIIHFPSAPLDFQRRPSRFARFRLLRTVPGSRCHRT